MPIPAIPSSGGTGFGTPISGGPGTFITLAQIEQATAQRLGPYRARTQSSVTTASVSFAYFDDLKSSLTIDSVTDLYMLRRGIKADGTAVTVSASDRQRIAAEYDAINGKVTTDRVWATPPAADEVVEFHFLDPANELRPAVLAGLRRCYFEDRQTITLNGPSAERDLTAALAWITRPTQLRRVQFNSIGSTAIPLDQDWWKPFMSGGHVYLAGWRDAYPNTLYVTAMRPHFTWVNGGDSVTGPTVDSDLLEMDLNYAVAAAHIEAWRLCRPRLQQAAEAGYQTSQKEAAEEFTRQASRFVKPFDHAFSESAPYGGPPNLSSVTR